MYNNKAELVSLSRDLLSFGETWEYYLLIQPYILKNSKIYISKPNLFKCILKLFPFSHKDLLPSQQVRDLR